jgi:hypothetical protein
MQLIKVYLKVEIVLDLINHNIGTLLHSSRQA